jgi:hypothetical protein
MLSSLILAGLFLLDTPERWHVNKQTNFAFMEQAHAQSVDGMSMFTLSLKRPFGDCPQSDEEFSLWINNDPNQDFDQARIDQLNYLVTQYFETFHFKILRIVLFEYEIDEKNFFNDNRTFNPNNPRWAYVALLLDLFQKYPIIWSWEECSWSPREASKALDFMWARINQSNQKLALHNTIGQGDLERFFGGLINSRLQLAEIQVQNPYDLPGKIKWIKSNTPFQPVVSEYWDLKPNDLSLENLLLTQSVNYTYFFYADEDQTLNDLTKFNSWFQALRKHFHKSQQHSRDFLLGRHSNAYGLDKNSDGVIDYADTLYEIP